jgi:hypothetical protein
MFIFPEHQIVSEAHVCLLSVARSVWICVIYYFTDVYSLTHACHV